MENLDKLCAEYGYKFANGISETNNYGAKKTETLITKALGVLQEQGLYAFGLFCESVGSTDKNAAKKLKDIAQELLQNKLNVIGNGELLDEIRKDNGLASKLDDLLFAIQVLEKSLIYARYHAKALTKSGDASQPEE